MRPRVSERGRRYWLWLSTVAWLGVLTASAASLSAHGLNPTSAPLSAVAVSQEHGGEPLRAENASEVSRQSVHGEPFWVVLARLVNFAILVGVLVYFLRAPIAGYLGRRSTEIRGDLVKASETRDTASAQLAAIERKMKALPAEIEALKARGVAEIAVEEGRIREAAAAERERLLAQARREIDLQVRLAERDLVRQAAELTIGLASDRIKRTITDEDRARLVERYLGQLQKES